ncbi:MAG TPA: GNAT family N-acetyltransferase [Burkholderiaceae bacterium]
MPARFLNTPMEIRTRLAGPEHKAAIWELYQSALQPHIETIWGWDLAWQHSYFEGAWSEAATLVVEADGALAGYLQLDLRPGAAYLRMLIIGQQFRGQRIGASLLAAVCALCEASANPLTLRVFRVNLAAQRFYQREGWRVVEEEETAYLLAPPTATRPATAARALCSEDFVLQLAG